MKYTPEQKEKIIRTIKGMIERDNWESIEHVSEDALSDPDIVNSLISEYPYIIRYVSPEIEHYMDYVGTAFLLLSCEDEQEDFFSYYELLSEMPKDVMDNTDIMSIILNKTLYSNEEKLFDTYKIEVLKTVSDKAMTKELLAYLYINDKISDRDIKIAFNRKDIIDIFKANQEKFHNTKKEFKESGLSSISLKYAYDFVEGNITLKEMEQGQAFDMVYNALEIVFPDNTNEYRDKYKNVFESATDKDKAIIDIAKDIISNPDSKCLHYIVRALREYADKDIILSVIPKVKTSNMDIVLNYTKASVLADKEVLDNLIEKYSSDNISDLYWHLKSKSVLDKDIVRRLLEKANRAESVGIYLDLAEERENGRDIINKTSSEESQEGLTSKDAVLLKKLFTKTTLMGEKFLNEDESFDFSTNEKDDEDKEK